MRISPPIYPGDLIVFMYSGEKLLVTTASRPKDMRSAPGQMISGIVTKYRFAGTFREEFWIVWSGCGSTWSICRLPVYDGAGGLTP